MVSMIALLFFPVVMSLAASSDLLTMRISNKLVLLLAAGFFVVAAIVQLPLAEFGLHLACAALVLVFGFAFYAFRWVGGGDAKLAAATTLYFGFGSALPYLLYAALLGGALTLLILAMRRIPLPPALGRVSWIARLHHAGNGVPYGIALAAAGLLTYGDTPPVPAAGRLTQALVRRREGWCTRCSFQRQRSAAVHPELTVPVNPGLTKP